MDLMKGELLIGQQIDYNRGYNILELCNILEKFRFITNKAVFDIQYKKHIIPVALRIANRDLKKLRNVRKMSKLSGEKAYSPVFIPEIKCL